MKKLFLLFSVLVFLIASVFAQKTVTVSTNLTGLGTQITKINTSTYDYGVYAIGKQTTSGNVNLYRTYFEFSLSSIPTNATITQVNVSYSNGTSGYTLKLTSMATVNPSDLAATWASIGSSSSLHTGLSYSGSSFNSNPIKAAMQNALSNRVLYIGALSEGEGTEGSYSSMTLGFSVTYTYPAAKLNLQVRNDLEGQEGGNIGVGIYPTAASSHASPYTFNTAYETDQLNLTAYDNQSVNGYNWVYNDNEFSTNKSSWKKNANGVLLHLNDAQSFTTEPLVASDNYATIFVYMRNFSVTTSGTLSRNEIWWTNVTLTGNVYVPTSYTLTLDSDAAVNLNGYSILSTGGIITDQGATISGLGAYIKSGSNAIMGYCNSIQSACNNAGSGQWIELQTRTYNESFSLSSKSSVNITGYGATINGNVTLNSSSYCNVYGLHLSDGYQFSVNGGTSNYLTDSRSDKSTGALNVYNTTTLAINNFTATNGDPNEFAVNISGSNGNVSSGSAIENYACGVYVGYNSNFQVTDDYFCSNGYDVAAENGGYAYLNNNYTYSRINPVSVYGNYSLYGSQNACGRRMMAKTDASSQLKSTIMSASDDNIDQMYSELIYKIRKDELKDKKALKDKYKPDYDRIIAELKGNLDKNLPLPELNSTISLLSHCYKWLNEKDAFNTLIDGMLSSSKYGNVAPYLRRYTIDRFIDAQDYKGAIVAVDAILGSGNIDQNLSCEMLYEKGLIYEFYLNDNSSAYKAFATIIDNYPKNYMARFAKGQLSNLPKGSEGSYLNATGNNSDEFRCSNYPNPFNPITRFTFSIPQDGYTELRIFNSLGQEVKTLVSENLTAGQYSYEWDASSLSSGIYFYILKCGDLVSSSKLIHMK